jgi:hypothetical protein
MEHNMKKRLVLVFLLLRVLNLYSQESEYDIIYALNFFDGISYNSTIIPYSVPEIYIQADRVNVFVVRETSLYYWPLTSEFKADWAVRNIPLEGALCIEDRQGKTRRISPQPYVIQYDMLDIPGTIAVYWGNEADRKHAEFMRMQRNYSEAVYAYNEAARVYDQQINSFFLNPDANPSLFPEVPIAPENFTLMSTGVNIGFPVQLPNGNYGIYFEDSQGKVIAKTKKRLRVFNPLKTTKGFQVFEEGRWSVPNDVPDSYMSVFAVPGGNIYLQPFEYLHYRGSEYNLMINPQNRYSENEFSVWVPVSLDSENKSLVLGGEELSLLGYKVTQLAGSRLGYIINPLEFGSRESSFSAFNIEIPGSFSGKTFSIGKSSSLTALRLFRGIEAVLLCTALIPVFMYIIISALRKRNRLYHGELV